LSKLTSNAFLAQRISSINAISALCEKTGADINEVANVVGSDSRIGSKFLSSSPGFGGSCFQKDLLNLVYLSKYYGLDEVATYWEQVLILNHWQRLRISRVIVEKLFGTITLKKIVLLGFSFKPNTNDIRESSAIYIANNLLENGAEVIIHDPIVSCDDIRKVINPLSEKNGSWSFNENLSEAVNNADAIVLLTHWEEYLNLNWDEIYSRMRKPAWVFDTRSLLNKKELTKLGFNFWGLGDGK